MTDRAGLDIGLDTLSSGVPVLSNRLHSVGRSTTMGADGKSDDQRTLSAPGRRLGTSTLVGDGIV